MNVYALRLKHEKYYIGSAKNPKLRFEQHMNGKGSVWTKIHGPLDLIEERPVSEEGGMFDEDNLTLEYMIKHGIENVRGGKYCRIKLSTNEKGAINRSIRHAQNLCLKCGGNHFVSKCTKGKLPQADLDLIQEIVDDDQEEVDDDPDFKRFNQRVYRPDSDFEEYGYSDS
jgi:predicted GIY-YIG superfamily endonuclease